MKENGKYRILFVCLGNICRSPAAHGIMEAFAARGGDAVEVDSAGTYGGHRGELPDGRMRRAAARRGYELTHRARMQIREGGFRAVRPDRGDGRHELRGGAPPGAVAGPCGRSSACGTTVPAAAAATSPIPYQRGARGLRAGARHVGGGVCQPARRDQKSKPKLTLHVLRRKVSRAAKR